jgi:hypothetical protein
LVKFHLFLSDFALRPPTAASLLPRPPWQQTNSNICGCSRIP